MFDWAKYKRTKGAIKTASAAGSRRISAVVPVATEGRTSEIKVARTLRFDPGTILAIDRGYIDYEWFRDMTAQEVYFVTRMKERRVFAVQEELQVPQNSNVVGDQIVSFPRLRAQARTRCCSRRVGDPGRGKGTRRSCSSPICWLLARRPSRPSTRTAGSGAVLQGAETDVEDQDVRGNSANAVRTQVWTALIAMLVLKYLQTEIDVFLVVIDAGRAAATTTVLLSRSVAVAGRSISGSAGHWPACTTTRNSWPLPGSRSWTAENAVSEDIADYRGEWGRRSITWTAA